MTKLFTRERFGEPQFLALLLLLVFLLQCLWLVRAGLRTTGVSSTELFHIQRGLRQWRGERPIELTANTAEDAHTPRAVVRNEGWDPDHSALYDLVSAAPLLAWRGPLDVESSKQWGWLARAPWLACGVLLGASLWYVARRLYGNAGGYIALVLYCFSPGMIRESAAWMGEPETAAAWAAFGAIFTAIAVAHTLYAPREVILWNWRRILLLGVALALAIGSQFSLIVLIAMTLPFMLYLAPTRRGAALGIWLAACLLALFILLASFFFHGSAFWDAMKHARFIPLTGQAFAMTGAYRQLFDGLAQSCPVLVVALPGAVATYLYWRRARYFGNTAPLLTGLIFLILGLGTPHYPGLGFRFVALPFFLVFTAGIAADLLETRRRPVVMASIWGLLTSYALWSLIELVRAT